MRWYERKRSWVLTLFLVFILVLVIHARRVDRFLDPYNVAELLNGETHISDFSDRNLIELRSYSPNREHSPFFVMNSTAYMEHLPLFPYYFIGYSSISFRFIDNYLVGFSLISRSSRHYTRFKRTEVKESYEMLGVSARATNSTEGIYSIRFSSVD